MMARTYGRGYAGSPGTPEDPTRCIEKVWSGSMLSGHVQCSRKRGHGPDGLYCKQHDPAAKKARQQKQDAKWEAGRKVQARIAKQARAGAPFYRALKQIADGANDARAIARDAIADYDDVFGDTP